MNFPKNQSLSFHIKFDPYTSKRLSTPVSYTHLDVYKRQVLVLLLLVESLGIKLEKIARVSVAEDQLHFELQ